MKKRLCLILIILCITLTACAHISSNKINTSTHIINEEALGKYTIGYYGVSADFISGIEVAASKYNIELVNLTDRLYESQFGDMDYNIDGFIAEFTVDERYRNQFFADLHEVSISTLEYNNVEGCSNIADITLLPCDANNLATGIAEFITENYSAGSKILITSVSMETSTDEAQSHTKELFEILSREYTDITMVVTSNYGFNDIMEKVCNNGGAKPDLVFFDYSRYAEDDAFKSHYVDFIYNTPLDSFLCDNHRFSYFPFSPYEKGYVAVESIVKAIKGESYNKEIFLDPYFCENISPVI